MPGLMDTASVILNESALKLVGLESPESAVGRQVTFGNMQRTVVGVVEDYRQLAAKRSVPPITFILNSGAYLFYTIRLNGANRSALSEMKKIYDTFWPKAPFDYYFLNDSYDRQYENEDKFSNVFTLFAVFAIIVACLGLFGLSSFSAEQRTREIGIRKVFGANVSSIVYLLSREYLLLIGIANAIAAPIIYYVMESWLAQFATKITVGLPVFLLSAFVMLISAVVAVGYKTILSAISNPVKALRYE
jgi:putative ABC transport system permease protein